MEATESLLRAAAMLLGIAAVYYVTILIANFLLLKKAGRNKWLGLVPFVNDYMLFDTFWTGKAFAIYMACCIGQYACGQDSKRMAVLSAALGTVNLFILVRLYDRIRQAYGKGFLWAVGMAACYPLFAIILAARGEMRGKGAQKKQKEGEPKQAALTAAEK